MPVSKDKKRHHKSTILSKEEKNQKISNKEKKIKSVNNVRIVEMKRLRFLSHKKLRRGVPVIDSSKDKHVV